MQQGMDREEAAERVPVQDPARRARKAPFERRDHLVFDGIAEPVGATGVGASAVNEFQDPVRRCEVAGSLRDRVAEALGPITESDDRHAREKAAELEVTHDVDGHREGTVGIGHEHPREFRGLRRSADRDEHAQPIADRCRPEILHRRVADQRRRSGDLVHPAMLTDATGCRYHDRCGRASSLEFVTVGCRVGCTSFVNPEGYFALPF